MADASIVQGTSFNFIVECRNSFGDVIPPSAITDAAVTESDPALGTVGVNTDGTAGQFVSTDGVGNEQLVGSAGGVSSPPFSLDITQDLTVAAVAIVPAGPPTAVASVRIRPSGGAVGRSGAPLRR